MPDPADAGHEPEVSSPEPEDSGPEPADGRGASTGSARDGEGSTRDAHGAADARRRTLRSLLRVGRGQLIIAVIVFLVAVAVVVQVRSHATDDAYSSARQEDLVEILDGLNNESRRLETEIENLQDSREQLRSGADRQRVARREARKRLDDLGILAGTVPAEGPGVRIRVTDPEGKFSPELMVEGVQELRDAGAEAIEINNSVRVVAETSFGGSAGAVTVDGEPIGTPIVIEAIGGSDSLASGASFRGGFADQVKGTAGGTVRINQRNRVVIDSLHTASDNQYARPAPSPSPTG